MKVLDDKARELAERNINLCHAFVNKYVENNKSLLKRFRWTLEDIQSVAYVGLCKAARDFDCGKGYKFSTLAYVAIAHEMEKEIRKYSRYKRRICNETLSLDVPIPGSDDVTLIDFIESDELRPEEACVEDECFEIVNRAIRASLNERDKNVLRMYLSGTRQFEIARQLGMSQPHVSVTLKRAYAKIRAYLETMGYTT